MSVNTVTHEEMIRISMEPRPAGHSTPGRSRFERLADPALPVSSVKAAWNTQLWASPPRLQRSRPQVVRRSSLPRCEKSPTHQDYRESPGSFALYDVLASRFQHHAGFYDQSIS